MDELLEQFLIEGRELVAQASRDMATLSRDPGDDAAIDSAFRAIHTLKGSVGLFAMQPAERLLHRAEDLLERARKRTAALDAPAVQALTACADQIDRWIDDMERRGALPDDAPAVSDRIIALLDTTSPVPPPPETKKDADWLTALVEREADIVAQARAPLSAFRYTPDADCFFRGEDPLAIIEAVPDLLALSILPKEGVWPSAQEIEPFSCFTLIEGLSAAPLDSLRTAFRLQQGQVEFAAVDAAQKPDMAGESRTETSLLRVEAARVDALADGLGDLIVAINALAPLGVAAEGIDRALAARLRAAQAGIERAAGRLHRDLSAVRLVPLEPALRRLPRLAREIAASLGKSVILTISGDGIEVDKQVADGLFEPLLHLLRNAIDHGIEAAEARKAAGKSPDGRVDLAFERVGDRIVATLRDDGGGIDPARIRRAAVERGLLSQDAADMLADAAALRLIFTPGFSTAGALTEVSGRGVGMDAVQAAIEKLRGAIDIQSTVGSGTCFTLSLPANALTTRLLVIEVGQERYGVALDQVVETVRLDRAALKPVGSGTACVLRNRTIPVLDLATLLDSRATDGPYAKLVITRSGGEPVALRVDDFAERIDTVVRPPSGILAATRGVIGSTLLGDGGVLLVLDLPELAA